MSEFACSFDLGIRGVVQGSADVQLSEFICSSVQLSEFICSSVPI